jgi:catechol 2,3-dioxygenase-like lactoylglutathione lyase family enzyme
VAAVAETPDRRPPVWTGHVFLPTADVAAAARFYEQIGMRPVAVGEHFAALEMRGGTHLVIHHDPQQVVLDFVPWDLMVEDIELTHDKWQAEGLLVTDVMKDDQSPHRRFEVTDPDGHVLVVRDTHVTGPV